MCLLLHACQRLAKLNGGVHHPAWSDSDGWHVFAASNWQPLQYGVAGEESENGPLGLCAFGSSVCLPWSVAVRGMQTVYASSL